MADEGKQAALAHLAALCDDYFLHQNSVAERVLLLISTAEQFGQGEVRLRRLQDDASVVIDVAPRDPQQPQPPKVDFEAEVAAELEILGFREGKLLLGGSELLQEYVGVKNQRRQQFHRDTSAKRAKMLQELFIAPRRPEQLQLTHEQAVAATQGFVARHSGVLAAGPFVKGLTVVLDLRLASADVEVEWVLSDSVFMMDEEDYLRDAAELLVQTLGFVPREITPEQAASLQLVQDYRDDRDTRRAWKVTLSRELAQQIQKKGLHRGLMGRATGEWLVDQKKVSLRYDHRHHDREDTSISMYKCCQFL